jgi:phospho-N-acetylmuramoyl-pentapeptide-transferase
MTVLLTTLTSFILSLVLFPHWIRFLKQSQHHQSVSKYAIESFKTKEKTPTLGGVVVVAVSLIAFGVFNVNWLSRSDVQIVLLSFLMYAAIGLWDDVKILVEHTNDGLSARFKFLLQLLFASVLAGLFWAHLDSRIVVPGGLLTLDLGLLYIPLILFMLSGSSNAVNITDGMDGLAGGTSLIALGTLVILAYVQNNLAMVSLGLSVLAALLAFMVFNRKPAQVYMGDVGSLALGAVMAAMAIVLKRELLFVLIGLVFVYETVCVILQIGSVKLFKRRIFKYTPIHYSFILNQWRETAVVKLFWLMGLLGALSALALEFYL